jgi:probable rRNA maturation factor
MRLSLRIDKQFSHLVKRPWLRLVVNKTLTAAESDRDIQLELTITDDDTVHEMNRMYRGVDSPTDVLAFALIQDSTDVTVFVTPPDEPPHLGEILISFPTAERQAGEHSHSVDRELAILVIHGVLHLLGYDHQTDEQEGQSLTHVHLVLGLALFHVEYKPNVPPGNEMLLALAAEQAEIHRLQEPQNER